MFLASRSNVLVLVDMGINPLLSSIPATSCHCADVPCGSARQLGSHGGGSLTQRNPEQLQPDLPMTRLACPTTRPRQAHFWEVVHLSQIWPREG